MVRSLTQQGGPGTHQLSVSRNFTSVSGLPTVIVIECKTQSAAFSVGRQALCLQATEEFNSLLAKSSQDEMATLDACDLMVMANPSRKTMQMVTAMDYAKARLLFSSAVLDRGHCNLTECGSLSLHLEAINDWQCLTLLLAALKHLSTSLLAPRSTR
ncbi:hypothetical protein E2320_000309 [Naja naja]|nr:hypothetical protein E2320_000309 [Naja naja]